METLLVALKNDKALKLLQNLEELNLIELLDNNQNKTNGSKTKLSSLKDKIISKMNESEIDSQLQSIRNEWQRDI